MASNGARPSKSAAGGPNARPRPCEPVEGVVEGRHGGGPSRVASASCQCESQTAGPYRPRFASCRRSGRSGRAHACWDFATAAV